jgi:arylsulfatase
VADESVPLLWGGFSMTAEIDTDETGSEGVVFALGDWFGGYALYLLGGVPHFTFARSADVLELSAASALGAGRHEIGIFYSLGEHGGAGRMVLVVDDAEVDEVAVKGMLPVAMQHGGAGLRLGRDIGFPVSPRYTPPAPFSGVVHQVRIDAPGARHADPADEVRAALHAD